MTGNELQRAAMAAVVLVALWIGACTGTERGGISIHTWRTLTADPTQAWRGARTQLYTYVLVGDIGADGGATSALRARADRALAILLKEVQAGQHLGSGDPHPLLPELLERANQFCIPAKAATLDGVGADDYDRALAQAYVNHFKLVVEGNEQMTQSLAGTGPFLIGTRKPLAELLTRNAKGKVEVDTTSPIVLVDMSGKHEATMPVYVLAYQRAVRKDVVSSTVLRPLSPAFASYVIELGEAVPFVAEAYAGTEKVFR